jgi:hypothetical protein
MIIDSHDPELFAPAGVGCRHVIASRDKAARDPAEGPLMTIQVF